MGDSFVDSVPPGGSAAVGEWRQHWRIAVGSAVGNATGIGLWGYVSSVFIIPLETEFGWTRGQQSLVYYALLIGGLITPALGATIDRFGVRRVMLPSMAIFAASLIGLAAMRGSLAEYYILSFVLMIGGMGTTGISFSRAIASWFDKSRGLALAVGRVGQALLGAVAPFIVYQTIAAYGWRAGYGLLALLVIGVGIPICLSWVKEREFASGRAQQGFCETWNVLRGRRSTVLIIVATATLTYAPIAGILSQLQPLLIGRGITSDMAAAMAGLIAVAALVGTFGTGCLVDRFRPPVVAGVVMLSPVIGCLLLVSPLPGTGVAIVAVLMIGVAQGAEFDLLGYLIAKYVGIRAFGTVYGICVLAMSSASASMAIMFGYFHDLFGHYNISLMVAALAFFLGSMSYPLLLNKEGVKE